MKNTGRFLLFFVIALLSTQANFAQAMDKTQTKKQVCIEQQLIDAMRSKRSCQSIIHEFFAKPHGVFTASHNIDYQDADGNTPLMVATIHDRTECIAKITHDYSPKLSLKNRAGQSVHTLKLDKMRLKTHGFSTEKLETTLWDMLYTKDYSRFSMLLELHPQLVNSSSISEKTFLAYISHTDIAQSPQGLNLMKKIFTAGKKAKQPIKLGAPLRWIIEPTPDLANTLTYCLPTITKIEFDKTCTLNALDMLLCQICEYDDDQHVQIVNNLVTCAQYLLSEGATFSTHIPYMHHNYDLESTKLKSILGITLFHRSPAALRLLINQPNIDIHARIGSWAPLTYAAYWAGNACPDVVKTLLQDPRMNSLAIQSALANSRVTGQVCNILLSHVHSPQPLNGQPGTPALTPGNTPAMIHTQWYKSPALYWIIAAAACAAVVYGVYTYWYPVEDEDDEDNQDQQPAPAA